MENSPPAAAVLRLRPRRVLIAMLATLVILAVMHVVFVVIPWLVGSHHYLWGLPRLFDIGGEGNLTAYWSTACLLFAAALLAQIAAETRRMGARSSGTGSCWRPVFCTSAWTRPRRFTKA